MKRVNRVKQAILAGLCAGVVATAIGLVAADSPQATAQPGVAAPAPSPGAAAVLPSSNLIADVAERVVPSVVNISTSQTVAVQHGPFLFDPFFSDPFSPHHGVPDERKAQSLGSGVIVSADGKILTNAHVVRNADEITVTLHDGTEHEAKVIGTDPKSDLAVIRLTDRPKNLVPLPFADSTKTRLGEVVLAVGNPFGVGQAVTMGIVSATGRASVGIVQYEDFIQTDAAINPGNSGGALVNLRGELVGINTAILSRSGGYQGIGFAIPTAMARPIMDMLIKDGKVSRGYLGVNLKPVKAGGRGVMIESVEDQAPAARAGIAPGDVILAVDGTEVRDIGKLRNLVAMKGANVATTLDVERDGKTRAVKVTLGELPEQLPRRAAPRVRRP